MGFSLSEIAPNKTITWEAGSWGVRLVYASLHFEYKVGTYQLQYKRDDNPYKWLYKWLAEVISSYF